MSVKTQRNKATFVCGPKGSGKSFIVEHYIPEAFRNNIVLENQDIMFEKFLKGKQNMVIDEVGSNTKTILIKKKLLESQGYDTMLIMSYCNPQTILGRNKKRENPENPSKLLKEWKQSINNISIYEKSFGDNFALVDNKDLESENGEFSFYEISSYFPKNEIIEEHKEKLTKAFQQKIKEANNHNFIAFDELTTKVKHFLE